MPITGHCFRHSPNISSKVGVEFIFLVLYIDGLSSFFLFHQTQIYVDRNRSATLLLQTFPVQTALCFLVFCDSIAQYIFTLFQPPKYEFYYVTIYLALLYICDRSLSGNKEAISLS